MGGQTIAWRAVTIKLGALIVRFPLAGIVKPLSPCEGSNYSPVRWNDKAESPYSAISACWDHQAVKPRQTGSKGNGRCTCYVSFRCRGFESDGQKWVAFTGGQPHSRRGNGGVEPGLAQGFDQSIVHFPPRSPSLPPPPSRLPAVRFVVGPDPGTNPISADSNPFPYASSAQTEGSASHGITCSIRAPPPPKTPEI